MTIYERIFKTAQIAFEREVFKLWPRIIQRAEHAIWLWNDKYGPLNPGQREFAADVICRALVRAGEKPTGHGIALYQTLMTSALNHEAVDAGFKRREESVEFEADVRSLVDSLYEGVGV